MAVGVITSGATVITPTSIVGYESSRPSRNLFHIVLNRAEDDVTLRPAGPRTGTMRIAFVGADSAADSAAAEDALALAATSTLILDDSTMQMTFVTKDEITRTLSAATNAAWVVSFGWQEVSP